MINDNHDVLIQRLREFNIYDLERLRDCFLYERKIEPENLSAIDDILNSIMVVMDEKAV